MSEDIKKHIKEKLNLTDIKLDENDEVIVVIDNTSYICTLNSDLLSASIKSVFKTHFLFYILVLVN